MTARAISLPAFISCANAFVGLRAGTELVEFFRRQVNRADRDEPWDYAFVQHVGYWSQFNAVADGSAWPVPLVESLDALATLARREQVLRQSPLPGDLALIHSPAREQFVRVAIVTAVEGVVRTDLKGQLLWRCVTVEADSDPDLSLRGGCVMRHWRQFSLSRGDRFVRWSRLVNILDDEVLEPTAAQLRAAAEDLATELLEDREAA